MVCLKCGRETDQSFCPECREVMQKYPIKPGTVVNLMNRDSLLPPKKVKPKAPIPPEQRIAQLRKLVARLRWINAILAALLLAVCLLAFNIYNRNPGPQVGQNYSTATQPTVSTVIE